MKKLTVGIRLLAVVILISALAACGGKAEKEETADNTDTGPVGPGDYFVDLNLGDDTYAGTADSPFLTITKAMSVAISGSTVTVRPGLYDALVETFPIVIPDGVDLLGDEPNKGAGGLGLDVRVHISDSTLDAVLAGSNSVVAGIRFTSYAADTGYSKSLLRVNTGSNTTFRNNTFDGHDPVTNGHGGLRTGTGALNITVTGNDFTGGLRYGMSLNGTDIKVENNLTTGNGIGAFRDSSSVGVDLGGGALASTGGNLFFCNTYVDLVFYESGGFMQNNYWDHVPQNITGNSGPPFGTGDDIGNPWSSAPLPDLTGSMLASSAGYTICP